MLSRAEQILISVTMLHARLLRRTSPKKSSPQPRVGRCECRGRTRPRRSGSTAFQRGEKLRRITQRLPITHPLTPYIRVWMDLTLLIHLTKSVDRRLFLGPIVESHRPFVRARTRPSIPHRRRLLVGPQYVRRVVLVLLGRLLFPFDHDRRTTLLTTDPNRTSSNLLVRNRVRGTTRLTIDLHREALS